MSNPPPTPFVVVGWPPCNGPWMSLRSAVRSWRLSPGPASISSLVWSGPRDCVPSLRSAQPCTRHPAVCRSCSWCRRASHVAAGICSAGSGSIRAITSDGLSMLASTSSGSHVCAPAALAAPLSVLKVSIEPTSWCAPESVSSLNYECSIQRPSDICMTSI